MNGQLKSAVFTKVKTRMVGGQSLKLQGWKRTKVFFLSSNDNSFFVNYTFRIISSNAVELEYELPDDVQFERAYIQGLLDTLKEILESD